MSEKTERPEDAEDRPAKPSKKPASDAPPVSGPNAPAPGGREQDTDANRKGGYGTG